MNRKAYLERLGKNIKRLRLDRSLTQETLSESANVTAQYLSYIETGNRSPSFEFIVDIADSLKVDLIELFQEGIELNSSENSKEFTHKMNLISQNLKPKDREKLLKIASLCSQLNKSNK